MLITPRASQPLRRVGVLESVMFVQVVSVMDETHDAAICDLGFMAGGRITWSRTLTLTTAGYWYPNHVNYSLTSDHQIVARFRNIGDGGGAAAGDIVHLNVNGYYLEPYESP